VAFDVRRLLSCVPLVALVEGIALVERVTLDVGAFLIPLVAGVQCVPLL
jgi:uncharacterized membrane protein